VHHVALQPAFAQTALVAVPEECVYPLEGVVRVAVKVALEQLGLGRPDHVLDKGLFAAGAETLHPREHFLPRKAIFKENGT
jgi:hypothetical protein